MESMESGDAGGLPKVRPGDASKFYVACSVLYLFVGAAAVVRWCSSWNHTHTTGTLRGAPVLLEAPRTMGIVCRYVMLPAFAD
jgi:hypothetical protein